MRKSVHDRFFSRIEFDPNGGCWLWLGSLNYGYGNFSIGYKTVRAHRFSYEMHPGEIPDGLCVCHKCDVRCCMNPNHFFLGTNGDNMADKTAKGRSSRGSGHRAAKLCEADIPKIRNSPLRNAAIAREYGLSRTTIGDIRNRRIWRHIP